MQKGVDILLAVDVYQHAASGNIESADIVASDLDFYPLFEALLQTPVRTTLWFDLDKTAPDLVRTADQARPLDLQKWLSWASERFEAYELGVRGSMIHLDPDFDQLHEGRLGDKKVVLYKHKAVEQFASYLENEPRSWVSKSEFAAIDVLETEPKQRVQWTSRAAARLTTS